MKDFNKIYRLIFRIAGSLAAIGYILFIIDEKAPLFNDATFTDVTIYLLFAVFILGFILLWKYELISGLVLIAWYVLAWCLFFGVWKDGGILLVLGFPIASLGVCLLIFGIKQKISSSSSSE